MPFPIPICDKCKAQTIPISLTQVSGSSAGRTVPVNPGVAGSSPVYTELCRSVLMAQRALGQRRTLGPLSASGGAEVSVLLEPSKSAYFLTLGTKAAAAQLADEGRDRR